MVQNFEGSGVRNVTTKESRTKKIYIFRGVRFVVLEGLDDCSRCECRDSHVRAGI